MSDLPKIRNIPDVGETPFRLISVDEKILQSWDKTHKRMVYLFKTESGNWGYYDKNSEKIVEVTQWKDKAALIGDRYLEMALYYRIRVQFMEPINYTVYEKPQNTTQTTQEAILNITKKAYDSLEEQAKGRTIESFYRFNWKKLRNGRAYVDSVSFVQ